MGIGKQYAHLSAPVTCRPYWQVMGPVAAGAVQVTRCAGAAASRTICARVAYARPAKPHHSRSIGMFSSLPFSADTVPDCGSRHRASVADSPGATLASSTEYQWARSALQDNGTCEPLMMVSGTASRPVVPVLTSMYRNSTALAETQEARRIVTHTRNDVMSALPSRHP